MRRRIPPLNSIRAFEAVARHGHLGNAAEELCVSHSALSQQIKLLEDWFGFELFVRKKGRLFLRPECRNLVLSSTRALDILQEAIKDLSGDEEDKYLVIQCDPAFFSKCLMGLTSSIRETSGVTDIEISTVYTRPKTIPDEVDILIHYQPIDDTNEIHSEHLVDINGAPACSPDLLERIPKPETPNDLKNFHLLHGDDRESWQQWIKQNDAMMVMGHRGTFYDDFGLTIQAAINGEGAIIADPIMCKQELDSGHLVHLFTETVFCVEYRAYCAEEKYRNPKVRAAFDYLVKNIRKLAEVNTA